MNANELVDELHTEDVQFSQQSVNDWAEEAVTMLRQQQAEIEALKADNEQMYKALVKAKQVILRKANEK
jgi:hypothetical protein